jgi:hypothetical protein
MEQHGVDVQFNRQQNIFVVGIDKDDRGVNSNSAYYFVIIPINASSVVGVSSEIVSNILLPVDYVKRSGCGGHVERGNNARRVVFPYRY